MIKRMLGKHNKIVFCILAVCLVFWGIGMSFLTRQQKKKEAEPLLVETIAQESYYFPAGMVLSGENFFSVNGTEHRLVYGRIGANIYDNKASVYYIEKEDKVIAPELPVYQKDGATMFLPEKGSAYRLFCTDFTAKRMAGPLWLSYGTVFNSDNARAMKEKVLLVDFGNGVYLNSVPLTIEGYEENVIPTNTFLRCEENRIYCMEFSDGVLYQRELPVTAQAMVTADGVRCSYYNLYRFCLDALTKENPELIRNGVVLEGDYYYYFLGYRYEIKGPSLLFETKDGLYLENAEKTYFLPECPLYEMGTDRIFLPRNYMVLQLNQHVYNCLPATSKVWLAQDVAYVNYQDVYKSYIDVLLHDGEEHYVVLSEATFRLDTVELTLSPMSCVYISDPMEIGFYQYDSEEYFTFSTGGKEPELEFSNGDVLFLYDRLIRREDGSLDLLQKDPTVFSAIQ